MKKTTIFLSALLSAILISSVFSGFAASAVSGEEISPELTERRVRETETEQDRETLSEVKKSSLLTPNITHSPGGKIHLAAKKVSDKNQNNYAPITLFHNGKTLRSVGRLINGVTYIPVRSFFGQISSMTVTYNSKSRTLSVRGQGLDMEIIDGSNVIYANGRTIYSITPSVIMNNGSMYAPISSVAKVISLSYGENHSSRSATLTGSVKALTHGSSFYDADALYWLSRIISAESKGEPLIGQIAVGNIVLNRVKSSLYPNTIWGVIFDRKYGVQFSPILNGTIYDTPSAASVTAAKICLETYRVLDTGTLFFLEPSTSTSSWIQNNKDYLFSIGNHDFYS